MHEAEPQQHSKLVTEMLKNSKGSDGTSLFEHLSLMLFQMPLSSNDKQLNNLEQFEVLSDFVKKHRFVQKDLHPQHVITSMVLADRKTKFEWASNAQTLQH